MILRITIDLFLDVVNEATLTKIRDQLLALKEKFRNINIGLLIEEKSRITVQKCYHDETPTKPCEIIFEWVKT